MTKTLFARLSQTMGLKQGLKRRRSPRDRRVALLESLESRLAFDAGWAAATQRAAVADMVGDLAGNTYYTGQFVSQATFGNITLVTNLNAAALYVAKSDALGNVLWATKILETPAPGTPSGNESHAIALDSMGNLYIAGAFNETRQIGPGTFTSAGGADAFLAKLDAGSGQVSWALARGDLTDDFSTDVTVDVLGNVVWAGGQGDTSVNNISAPVMFVSKLDGDGSELWTRNISGSSMYGRPESTTTDSSGAIYISGRLQGTAYFPTGAVSSTSPTVAQALVSKLDADGQWEWARIIDSDGYGIVWESGIGQDGRLYVAGAFEGTAQFGTTTLTSLGLRDGFVACVDPTTGDVVWAKPIGGAGTENAFDLAFDPSGELIVAGAFQGTAYFGAHALTTGDATNTPFIARLSTAGAFLQAYRFAPDTNHRLGLGISVDGNGAIYAFGNTSSILTTQLPQQELALSPKTGINSFYRTKLPPAAPTKFFVADDAPRDRTYQYAANGELTVDHFSFSTANTAPRGAASTTAGDKIWIVDANKTVYIYSASGTLLGSWTAGGLTSNSQIEGITTNGTDIWLVDAQQDKVFKYAGAASRLSGSQSASSNFKLNSANSNAKDLVTDGASIWVVNDASTDKIFKYSMTGALVGSWTMTTPGASSPTGITLNPASPSALWVVDNGSDKIYQYDAATSVTSGSLSASKTFPLAVGNTNPQGIADPPVGSAEAADEAHQAVDTQLLPHSRMSVDAPPASSRAPSFQVNTHSESPHLPIVGSEFQRTNDWALNAVQSTISHDEQMLDSLADELATGRQIQRRRLSRVGI